jgi:hypothetical protein
MPAIEVKTGDIEKWASKMEEKGADFAADVVKKVKGNLEQRRKKRAIKFAKIRRKQSGAKRFAIVAPKGPEAVLVQKSKPKFQDVFKGK